MTASIHIKRQRNRTRLEAARETEAPTPVDFTGQRVIFGEGAPVRRVHARAALHWVREHVVQVPHLPPTKPENTVRHYAYLEAALLSREMDRL